MTLRDDDCLASDLGFVGCVGAGVEDRRPPDLGALADLDLRAPGDDAVPSEVHREWAGGGTRGRILGHAERGDEHPGLPLRAGAGEAVRADAFVPGECGEVGAKRCDRVLVGKADVDVAWAVLVDVYGEQRLLDAERREQLLRPLVRLTWERRLLHPAEADAAGRPLELQRDEALTRLEAHVVAVETLADEEGRPEDRVPRERQLRHRREDPHARVAATLGRE